MKATRRALLVLAAVVLLVGVMPALAQEPSVAQGQLVRVDANAKTIAIRTPQGTQMQFSYTDDTKVIGADESVAGLATMAGADLTVHYTKKQQDNVATQIEVRKKQ
jgi:YD repeat-containing protein